MKKRIIVLLAFALFAAGSAHATTVITGGTSVSIGSGNFTPSQKVYISVTSNGTSYGAASQHSTGTTAYATGGGTGFGSDTTKIYSAPCGANNAACGATPPTSSATALPTAPSGSWQ